MPVRRGRRPRRPHAVRAQPALSEFVRVVVPHLRSALISTIARERLSRAARQVPSSDLAGFECALDEARRTADLIVRLPPAGFDIPTGGGALWRRIHSLSVRLRDNLAPHFESVNVMGLEYDVPSDDTAIPPPALFFELNSDVGREGRTPHLIALTGELFGRSAMRATAALLRRCVEALPADSAPFQLGAMLSRPGEAVRLVISDVPPHCLLAYLRDIAWKGDERSVSNVVNALSPYVDSFALSMDLAHVVHPRIGLECYVSPGSGFLPGWRRLLDRLVEFELCSAAKADGLLAWSGVCQESTCPDVWPPHLRWGDRLLGPRATSVIARTLGHVKVVVQPERPLEAKAYLGFAHYWIERRAQHE